MTLVDRSSVQTRSASVSSNHVEVELDVSNSATAAQRAKLNAAAETLERVLNDPRFEAALAAKYGASRAKQMIAKLRNGSEVLSPSKDHEADLSVGFFDPKKKPLWRRKIAMSSSNRELIQLNASYFESRGPNAMAQTLAHMFAFKLGYDGKAAQAFSEITGKLATSAAPSPAPTPNPTPTTPTVPTTTPAPSGDVSPSAILGAFKQGGTGNCVSIAAIKAGMARFGPDGVLAKLERVEGGYEAVMRDGYKVRFTDAEVKLASQMSEIRELGDAELTKKANILYTAMAKRAQAENNDGKHGMSLTTACKSLNNGENYYEGAHWLGLDKHVKKIDPKDISKYVGVVAASKKHAVFASGDSVDHYGKKRPAKTSSGLPVEGYGRALIGAYAIV